MQHAVELAGQVRIFGFVFLEASPPGVAQLLAALAHPRAEVLPHAFGDQEFGVFGPAVSALGEAHFLFSQRLAVRSAGVLFVRRTVGDMAVDDDEGGPVAGALEHVQRAFQHLQIVGIADARDIPAIADEAGGHVLAERQRGMAFDGDLVVVVNPAKIGKAMVARQRRGFPADALHHVAIAANGVDVVIEHVEAGTVEMLRHPPARHGHADAIADALTQRTGGGFDARRPAVFGVAGTTAVELPETLNVFQLDGQFAERLVLRVDGLYAAQMQQRIKQHGGVAETVAVGPNGIFGIEAQEMLPHRVGHRRQRHGRAGMSGVGLLHRVHGEGANGVDRKLVELLVGHESRSAGRIFIIPWRSPSWRAQPAFSRLRTLAMCCGAGR